MKSGDRSIKKKIKRKITLQQELNKMNERQKKRTSGTVPLKVELATRDEIRRGPASGRMRKFSPETTTDLKHVPETLMGVKKKTCIINQYAGIGDILFIEPIMRYYFQNDYDVILPVVKKYLDVSSNFPYIKFVDKDLFEIDYNEQRIVENEDSIILPLRFSYPSMRNKYEMLGLDLNKWKELTWLRHRYKEDKLKKYLGINEGEKYNLINTVFHTYHDGYRKISLRNGLKNIHMTDTKGYSLLDWSGVIEGATNIHTVNTSIIYMLEKLDLMAKEVHIYSRNENGADFNKTDYLFDKYYIRHN